MGSFKKLSIRGKIVSIILIMVLLMAALSASSIYALHGLNDRVTTIVDVDAEKMLQASRVEAGLLKIHRAQKNLILSYSNEMTDRFIALKEQETIELLTNLARLEKLVIPDERERFRQLQVHLEAFLDTDRAIEALAFDQSRTADVSQGRMGFLSTDAVALSMESGRRAYGKASELIGDIVQQMETALVEQRTENQKYFDLSLAVILTLCGMALVGSLFMGLTSARTIVSNLNAVVGITDAIADDKLDTRIEIDAMDETGRLAESVKKMQSALLTARNGSAERDWIKTGIARINKAIQGKEDLHDLCSHAVSEIATYLNAQAGAVFLLDEKQDEPVLTFTAGYAYTRTDSSPDRFLVGEGLPGQAVIAKTPITVSDLPGDYFKVCSGLGDCRPASVTVAPLMFENQVNGVLELGFLGTPSPIQMEYLEKVLQAVAVNVVTARGRLYLADSLARARLLTEELQKQKDELKTINEELEEQTQRLKESEEKLKKQQEELEVANVELEEKNEYLKHQKQFTEKSNRELEQTRREIEEKAEQLALTSKYKSEFLANMSHELRTPLNSILLLGGMLAENKENTLTEDQVRSAEIVVNSGNDLLILINDVLDLAKIEAGKMNLNIEPVDIQDVVNGIHQRFEHMASEKGLGLESRIDPESPATVNTDRNRLDQILRNLLSNAVKFTEKGNIVVQIGRPGSGTHSPAVTGPQHALAITVRDTGIGIPAEKQKIIFEAFQQLDSGTARKYTGTGLGLSISRELALLMGGNIFLDSRPGEGTAFTLVLPQKTPHVNDGRPGSPDKYTHEENEPDNLSYMGTTRPWWASTDTHRNAVPNPETPPAPTIGDDREELKRNDAAILIIEDDFGFAEHLVRLCRQKDLKVLFAPTGEQGIELANAHLPKGIFLDIRLPGKDGIAVLEVLKANPRTRHIPIHIISVEDESIEALQKGAIAFLTKPVSQEALEAALGRLESVFEREVKELLVVEDDDNLRQGVINLIGNTDVRTDGAATAQEAITAIKSKQYDCMILDLGLPDMNGLDMLRKLETEIQTPLPPVIVYTGRELTREQANDLRQYSETVIIKGVRSQERLFDEASLFLHRVVEKMPEKNQRMITNLHDSDSMFRDRTVLIVDDDMRNVFALSKILKEKGMNILKAENGRKAIELIGQHENIDLVLMDMMMPVMDGYESMKRIRMNEQIGNVPIIALTAKAMKQDREYCIAAGANDYLSKPVDLDRLFSMMRVWMYQ